MKVLISGAGIAGPTLAFWLAHYGFKPTIVEAAPPLAHRRLSHRLLGRRLRHRRPDGPVAGDHGARDTKCEDRSSKPGAGKRISGFAVDAFSRVTQGRFVTLPRTEMWRPRSLARLKAGSKPYLATAWTALTRQKAAFRVRFESGGVREFDLVVGADRLHSRVRQLVFGEEKALREISGIQSRSLRG